MTQSTPRTRPARAGGFTLIEIMIALFVLIMMVLLVGAVFPVATRASRAGGNYAQATLIAQRKIDQCRQASYGSIWLSGNGKINATKLAALNIVDHAADGSTTAVTGDGFSYSFAQVDNLVDNGTNQGYFPAGSTGVLRITQYKTPAPASQTVPAVLVTVTISWVGAQGAGTYTTSTVVGSY